MRPSLDGLFVSRSIGFGYNERGVEMDFYDSNMLKPTINGEEIVKDNEINYKMGIPQSKIVGGKGIIISNDNGTITISRKEDE